LIAIQLPMQPSDRLNVPAPVLPESRPTAERVMPFPAPTECNVPSGSTCPLPPWTTILPPVMMAGKVPVCGQPALVNFHTPSKPPLSCGGDRGASSAGRSVSFRGPDRDLSVSLMLPPVEPGCASAATRPDAMIVNAPMMATFERNPQSRITTSNDRHWVSSARPELLELFHSSSMRLKPAPEPPRPYHCAAPRGRKFSISRSSTRAPASASAGSTCSSG